MNACQRLGQQRVEARAQNILQHGLPTGVLRVNATIEQGREGIR
jgi:hypothetical protein